MHILITYDTNESAFTYRAFPFMQKVPNNVLQQEIARIHADSLTINNIISRINATACFSHGFCNCIQTNQLGLEWL